MWWQPKNLALVKEAVVACPLYFYVKLKAEALRVWLAQDPEEAERYLEVIRAVASIVGEAKIQMWEELREAMEKNLWLALRKFWQTIRGLRKEKQGLAQAAFSRGEELLTLTGDIFRRWKEHFEEHLSQPRHPLWRRQSVKPRGEASPISLVEVSEVVKKLLSGKASGVLHWVFILFLGSVLGKTKNMRVGSRVLDNKQAHRLFK